MQVDSLDPVNSSETSLSGQVDCNPMRDPEKGAHNEAAPRLLIHRNYEMLNVSYFQLIKQQIDLGAVFYSATGN